MPRSTIVPRMNARPNPKPTESANTDVTIPTTIRMSTTWSVHHIVNESIVPSNAIDIPCPGMESLTYSLTHSLTNLLTYLGFGVFTSISFCYIECDDALCSNAIDACQSLHLCQGVLRSDIGRLVTHSLTHTLLLTGQLVRLVHFNRNTNHEFTQQLQQQACFSHGRNVSQSELGQKFLELNKQKQNIIGAHSFTHSLTHSLTYSLTRSLTHSLTIPC